MAIALAFAVTLLLAVLVSDVARRSVLSTAVLFLLAGMITNLVVPDLGVDESDPAISILIQLALFSTLFDDGMQAGFRDLAAAWRLPGRALLLGLPLTFIGTTLIAHLIVGLTWAESLLLGAVLSPTDPVLAGAIVGREDVPARLRRLLNVESGLNDGLALPAVIVMLAVLNRTSIQAASLVGELALGVGLGIAVPWIAIQLGRSEFVSPASTYEPLYAFAIGLLVLVLASLVSANLFLAAFSAGITLATIAPEVRDAFRRFGELIARLLKLAALLLFGALISLELLNGIGVSGYIFALLSLIAVRPVALGIALLGSQLPRREWLAAAWFGPKGFASMVYGLLILKTGIPNSAYLFHLVALVIVGSVILHSSTDVVVARWFRKMETMAEDSI